MKTPLQMAKYLELLVQSATSHDEIVDALDEYSGNKTSPEARVKLLRLWQERCPKLMEIVEDNARRAKEKS